MNPVLLKPMGDRRSQVIVEGRPIGAMSAMEYERYKPQLRERIRRIYEELESEVDAVVIEGAGSPAEINLKAGDIVNMAMAAMADAPVLLVGDINPGGVFAAFYGTVKLLSAKEQERVKGIVINKFRGDVRILEPGLDMLEELLGIPVLGVIPWMDVDLEDEDSVTERFSRSRGQGSIQAVIVHLPQHLQFHGFQSARCRGGCRGALCDATGGTRGRGHRTAAWHAQYHRGFGVDEGARARRGGAAPRAGRRHGRRDLRRLSDAGQGAARPAAHRIAPRAGRRAGTARLRRDLPRRQDDRAGVRRDRLRRGAGCAHSTGFGWTATRFTAARTPSARTACRFCA